MATMLRRAPDRFAGISGRRLHPSGVIPAGREGRTPDSEAHPSAPPRRRHDVAVHVRRVEPSAASCYGFPGRTSPARAEHGGVRHEGDGLQRTTDHGDAGRAGALAGGGRGARRGRGGRDLRLRARGLRQPEPLPGTAPRHGSRVRGHRRGLRAPGRGQPPRELPGVRPLPDRRHERVPAPRPARGAAARRVRRAGRRPGTEPARPAGRRQLVAGGDDRAAGQRRPRDPPATAHVPLPRRVGVLGAGAIGLARRAGRRRPRSPRGALGRPARREARHGAGGGRHVDRCRARRGVRRHRRRGRSAGDPRREPGASAPRRRRRMGRPAQRGAEVRRARPHPRREDGARLVRLPPPGLRRRRSARPASAAGVARDGGARAGCRGVHRRCWRPPGLRRRPCSCRRDVPDRRRSASWAPGSGEAWAHAHALA